MSIKTELSQKRREAITQQIRLEQRLEPEARKFIEEVIIPRFRLLAKQHPTQKVLSINLFLMCTAYQELPMACPLHADLIKCTINIARAALMLASEYDITSTFDRPSHRLEFSLVLD